MAENVASDVLDGLENDFRRFILPGDADPHGTICVVIVKVGDNKIKKVEIFRNKSDSIPEEAIGYIQGRRKQKIQLYINRNCVNIEEALMENVTEIKLAVAEEVNLADRVTLIHGDDWVSLFECLHWKSYSMPYKYNGEDTSFEKEDEFMSRDWQNLFEN